mmetsp:Transcript_30243/g.62289  ORF Transcript_30243/g.62289 Transcript_30243/m.62289 type:complete len:113 (+) Transcript_30243:249-587(+)
MALHAPDWLNQYLAGARAIHDGGSAWVQTARGVREGAHSVTTRTAHGKGAVSRYGEPGFTTPPRGPSGGSVMGGATLLRRGRLNRHGKGARVAHGGGATLALSAGSRGMRAG